MATPDPALTLLPGTEELSNGWGIELLGKNGTPGEMGLCPVLASLVGANSRPTQ